MKKSIQIILVVIGLLIAGCHVKYTPVVMKTTTSKPAWILAEKTELHLQSGSTTHLKADTTWEYVGAIEQGDVYKTHDQIVTIKGPNMFEAYIVLSEEHVVGFYLPVEKAYSRISKPIRIKRKIVN
jgi:hypothetical protein